LTAALALGLALQQAPTVHEVPGTLLQFSMVALPTGKVHVLGTEVETKPVEIATTETTWEMFDAFLISGPPSPPYDQTQFAPDAVARPSRTYIVPDLGWGHKGYPVINVSYTNAEMFCRWLSATTGKKYRLPTMAEWQLAASAGWKGPLDEEAAKKSEWFAGNSEGTTHPVGTRAPNPLGLYDVLGNTGEWATDPSGKPVLCGGDIRTPAKELSPLQHRYYDPSWQERDPQLPKSRWWLSDGWFVGFRLVCEK
jgi:formylglycine-generating enzyme required for sulfatase activity